MTKEIALKRDNGTSPQHGQGEIVLYQPDETICLEVRMGEETVWLTQQQMAELFSKDRTVIGRHIRNIYKEAELREDITCAKFAHMGTEGDQRYEYTAYNLDVIISVGYRVKSQRGTRFRQWANQVLKDYLLRGYAVNQQLMQMERRLDARIDAHTQKSQQRFLQIESTLADHQEKIDFFVRTNQSPVEGVLFEGQIFDAYKLVEGLVKSARKEIILIDNYVDASTFDLLEQRGPGVEATLYTEQVSPSLVRMQQLCQQQYGRRVELKAYNHRFHDRFLILDDDLYHFGASFKDLGKRLFAFTHMDLDKNIIINQL